MSTIYISMSASASTATDPKTAKRVAYLETLLVKAKDFYYNKGRHLTVKGVEITDSVYDRLEKELAQLAPKSKVLKMVRVKTKAPGRKIVKLPFYLGSLDKLWAGEPSTQEWLDDHSQSACVISDKLDGYSVPVVRENGQWRVYSAGDDKGKAMDISHLAPYIGLPESVKDGVIVRGELQISKSKFNAHGSDFKNSRNMVASVVTRIKPHESIQHFSFIAHELMAPRMKPSQSFAWLKRAGFRVVPHKVIPAGQLTEARLLKFLKARKASAKFDIDGVVVTEDRKVPLTVGRNPTTSIAFKDNESEEIVSAVVRAVIWDASKHGFLKPVVHIKPVELSGVTVSKASGKNAFTIVNGWPKKDAAKHKSEKPRPIGPGAVVKLVRSGGVIPDILEVLKPARAGVPQMPKQDYVWNDSGLDIIESEVSDVTLDKKITAFFRTMGVENLALSTVSKLSANGLDTVGKILAAKPARFMKVPGIQEVSAKRLYTNIHEKMRDVPLHVLMDASGLFGRGIGQTKLLPVLKKYPSLIQSDHSRKTLYEMALEVDGFADNTAEKFSAAFPRFLKWLAKAEQYITWKMPRETLKLSNTLQGQVVAFTGFRDKSLETQIAQNGGKVGSGVNSKTTILLVSSLSDTSSKVKTARAMGSVKIFTPDKFKARFKIK